VNRSCVEISDLRPSAIRAFVSFLGHESVALGNRYTEEIELHEVFGRERRISPVTEYSQHPSEKVER